MTNDNANIAEAAESSGMLGAIERIGNKVPTPAIMFVYLIAGLMVLSAIVAAFDVSVTEDVAIPVPFSVLEDIQGALGGSVVPYDVVTNEIVELPDYVIQPTTFEVRSLLSVDGLRFFFSTFVANFAAFNVVAVTLVAMAGVGVAEISGLMAALIRKIVKVAPPAALAYILILVGVVSSVATDAGYLILIPLGAAAFLSVGRHPLAGMAAAFAGVSAVFGVNVLITPTDSMITEITNEAIGFGRVADQHHGELLLQHRVDDSARRCGCRRHRSDDRTSPRTVHSTDWPGRRGGSGDDGGTGGGRNR